jgi:hypothetical protein
VRSLEGSYLDLWDWDYLRGFFLFVGVRGGFFWDFSCEREGGFRV